MPAGRFTVVPNRTNPGLVFIAPPLGVGQGVRVPLVLDSLGGAFHCDRDMAPVLEYYPTIERCSWTKPQYYELLRRAIRWALGETA